MKRALKKLATSIILVLIIPLSAWAGFVDLLINPATLLTCTGRGTINFIGKILNDPDIKDSNHFDNYKNEDSTQFFINNPLVLLLAVPNDISNITTLRSIMASPNKLHSEDTEASIGMPAVVIANKKSDYSDTTSSSDQIQTAMTSKDTNKVVGLGVFTDAGEARIYTTSLTEFGMVKVFEPSTMLLLGSCLLCIGLFALKFRK